MKIKNCMKLLLTVMLMGILFVTASCSSFPFKDVSSDSQYYDAVAAVYELGLMDGKDKISFAPEGTLSYGEIASIAAKLHALKAGSAPIEEQGDVWYQAYIDYCKASNIITEEYNWQDIATRAACIDILANAVQPSVLNEKNYIAENAIPDVSASSEYYDSIYKFYRAGIFQGVDALYNCNPDGVVYRYELAEMLNLILNPAERYSFVLVSSGEQNQDDGDEAQYADILIMRTPIGDFYYPGKWIGMVSSRTVSTSKGYIAEIYGKTEKKSLLLATFYIGTEQNEGISIGYVNKTNVRVNVENPDLSALSEEDRITFYGMKEDINYIIKQIMGFPGYESTIKTENVTDPNQGGTEDPDEPNQGGTNTEKPEDNPNQGNTGTQKPDDNNPNQGNTGTEKPDDNPNQGGTNTDDPAAQPDQGGNENTPDFALLNTSIGTLYYPGRWTGKVWATPVASVQGNIYDVYCNTNSGTVKVFSIYIGTGLADGFLVGYVGINDVRIAVARSTLTGWSEADKKNYYSMQEDVNYIIEQITSMPGYTSNNPIPDISGGGSGSIEYPDNNNNEEEVLYIPWENGGKQPSEYTWAEFEALSPALQMEFQKYFGNIDAFDAWMQKAQGNGNEAPEETQEPYPWEIPGAKQPSEYTWAEFEALASDYQIAFQNAFSSIDAFEAWRQKVQGNTNEEPGEEPGQQEGSYPWEKTGAKQPSEYTWAEFEALAPEHQIAFQKAFDSIDAFDAWMQKAQGNGNEGSGGAVETYPWEKTGAKQPSEYTWAEFEALSPEYQMAFQKAFDSIDAFDAWMQKAQGNGNEGSGGTEGTYPWEKPGAKKPEEYTWAEFEALEPEYQIAFQFAFDTSDGFDKWLAANG